MTADSKRPLVATYRLQLHKGFNFAHAKERLPYLQKLGVSHLYLSPVLQAARGSTHGYDLIDPTSLSDELGGRAGFEALADAAHQHGMGLIVDIVPNHMSIADPRNRWWWDVLEYGPTGRWAHAFDVDWESGEPGAKDKVLLPVLADRRHRVLERRELKVHRAGGLFYIEYQGMRFPLTPKSIGVLVREAAATCNNQRILFLADAYEQLEHHGVIGDLLEELLEKSPMCATALDKGLAAVNDDPARLDALLDEQCYRLAYWRRAELDLDYRRFFDINSLVGLHTEDLRIFEATHALIGELVGTGYIDGLRVDHVDGLANPRVYLERLRRLAGPRASIHVEKILAHDEELRDWPVDGTTGYEFAADVTALFVPPDSEPRLSGLQAELALESRPFAEVATEARAQVIEELLGSDLNRLTWSLCELRNRYADTRDFTRHELRTALRAFVASFPAYRSYVEPGQKVDAADVALIDRALKAAKEREPALDSALFDLLRELMTGQRDGALEQQFVTRVQQLTAPAMAKGVEDTAHYRDVRLLALNDVGGSPERFTLGPQEFHERQVRAQALWPRRMLTLTTHDTKRSADVRARLVAMAWAPEGYEALARDFLGGTGEGVDRRTKLLALQTLIGGWPLDLERFESTLLKSVREAKLYTRWTRNDEAYEKAVKAFAKGVLENEGLMKTVGRYVRGLDPLARGISLSWTLLACTAPGVPDVYQGTELWSHLLVDPDNRREVDWAARDEALEAAALPPLEVDEKGANKLHVLRRALALRRRYPEAFGAYEALRLQGSHAGDAVAFSRGGSVVTVVATRPVSHWGDTSVVLPAGDFESLLISDGRHAGAVRLAALLEALPCALLKKT
ncbi:MAG: malto-oligosyltrehalose synthase [Myxococcaceae bacterium]|nr:malto-oligosyltrehalose synthase [Myxococcaceae bacterium]